MTSSSNYPKYILTDYTGALRQGEILSNVIQLKLDMLNTNMAEPVFDSIIHPFVVIVSQDCDLDWDHRARIEDADEQKNVNEQKKIPSILLCELALAEASARTILQQDNAKNLNKSRTWSKIKINKDERYQFFELVDQNNDLLKQGLPELVADFKRYLTIPTDELYKRIERGEIQRRCRLNSPYLEHFCSRFYYFQSRVALPEEHYSVE